jgi:MFS family permease
MTRPGPSPVIRGIEANRVQIALLLTQVLFTGLMLGITRTVVPALAETEFGLAKGSFLLLSSFVIAFGVVKAAMNLVAGGLSDRIGRRAVLIAGWLCGLPVPLLIWSAPDWNRIVVATLLLAINQGLCWSMTQTAKLDLTRAGERGLVMGLNEFAGYAGVAAGGLATAGLAVVLGPRPALLLFGLLTAATALALAVLAVRETSGSTAAEGGGAGPARSHDPLPPGAGVRAVLVHVSWRDKRLFALCQAGLVEKFVDALVWIALPAWLFAQGVPLPAIGWIAATYGLVWGVAQIGTGRLSDRIGRHLPNVAGMAVCALGVAMFPLAGAMPGWIWAAATTGLGMALLYPNLSAAVADVSAPPWRGTAIGIYRFWRDLGYAVGAVGIGLSGALTGSGTAAFWVVAGAMLLSGGVLWRLGAESHPRLAARGPGAD